MQEKLITKNWDKIKPASIESFINYGGYLQLKNCVYKNKKPNDIVDQIDESGLRGRGGAGFPTGKKWKIAKQNAQKNKKDVYFIVNADESQPGTFKDGRVIEKNPHSIIEGAAVASYALEASKVIIYVNGHHKDYYETLKNCVNLAYERGFLGKNILDKNVDIEMQVVLGSGGYIFGEETTLINSLEGYRGEPRMKPPFPPELGFLKNPTVVNNVETVINIPIILEIGAAKYKKIGCQESNGTKLFSVLGAVKNPGLYEAPLGITIRDLIYDYCGGLEKSKQLDFVQVGWMGNFFTQEKLDYKLSYQKKQGNALVGLGSVLVVDKDTDIRDLVLAWSEFFQRESCGQCTPCREGSYRLLNIAERLKNKQVFEKDLQNIKDLNEVLEKTSFCPFGCFIAQCWKGVLDLKQKELFKNL
ncbi:MAG: NADH-quinone oxidoreductase subunit F [Candidatus Moranbacteria bacterium]|nr:NADH-quinone oxidoreductase subunit F [Candidatus Moranbacteria bacterium]